MQGSWSERWGTFPELAAVRRAARTCSHRGRRMAGQGRREERRANRQARRQRGRADTNLSQRRRGRKCACRWFAPAGRISSSTRRTAVIRRPDFEMQGDPQSRSFEIGDTRRPSSSPPRFSSPSPRARTSVRGYWSWTADGTWMAPKNPKLKFAGNGRCSSCTCSAVIPHGQTRTARNDFCADFIRAFIPALEVALKPALEKAGRVAKPAETADKPAAPAPSA